VTLNSTVSELKGVGAELEKKLASVGIYTISDLIENVPRKYEDYSKITKIKDLRPGVVTLEAKINQIQGRYVRRGLHITEAIVTDDTGSVRLVWFNQPYRAKYTKRDQPYFVAGEYNLRRGRFSILNPSVELVSDFPVNTARIIPIYREAKNLKSLTLRKLVREAIQNLDHLPEHLPDWLIKENELVNYPRAITQMHFPSGSKALALAKQRIGFEEVFELSLAALLNKYELYQNMAIAIPFKEKLVKDFVSKLPFKLTNAQRKVAWQVYQDIAKTQPMNRLIEGDVGSGKTLVATMAAVMAMEQGFQVALMAPTEILARQHADTIYKLLSNINYENHVGLLIGGLTRKQKALAHEKIASGEIKFIIGTHALIAEKVDMHKLGLIIIDEQHRFGVEQRKKLQAKAGHMPHVLHMTATPIPRSLALTLYGELDISVIDELPPGRQRIITRIVSPNSRSQLNEKIDAQIESGRQVFVVCPIISPQSDFTTYYDQPAPAKNYSAEEVFERMSKKDFKHRRVGLLHGKMKSAEKDEIMKKFQTHEFDILVSTTVIEVGLDIPNASVMVIEGAERFGLAQIHQLRGRVGRGEYQSYCYLVPSDSQAPSTRMRALETINDGFKLAELDLELRGPGAIYGTMQHGALDLRVAKLTDTKLISTARNTAQKFIDKGENIKNYPRLDQKVTTLRAVTNLN
jgi:ATP-dependent DNA helicase RecG